MTFNCGKHGFWNLKSTKLTHEYGELKFPRNGQYYEYSIVFH